MSIISKKKSNNAISNKSTKVNNDTGVNTNPTTATEDYFIFTDMHVSQYGEKTVVLLQIGDFFEIYGLKLNNDTIIGSIIQDVSTVTGLTVVFKKTYCKNKYSKEQLPVMMAGFKVQLLEKYLRILQQHGFTVAVYEQKQINVPESAKPKFTRILTGVYSAGTYISNDPDIEHITNNTACIWIETVMIQKKLMVYMSCAVVDIFTGSSNIIEVNAEYLKNPTTFDDLEHFISSYLPSETIIISNLSKLDIEDIIGYINLQSKIMHNVSLKENMDNVNNSMNQTYQKMTFMKFFEITDIDIFMELYLEYPYAASAFTYLLNFIFEHNPNLVKQIDEPMFHYASNKLVLANHSAKQLNIINDHNSFGTYSSVSKMLNKCNTSIGKRLFENILLNPMVDSEALKNEYDMTECLMNTNNFLEVKKYLEQIRDISKYMRLIINKTITPKNLYMLFESLKQTKCLIEYILTLSSVNEISMYLFGEESNFNMLLKHVNNLIESLNYTFVMNACKNLDNLKKLDKLFLNPEIDNELNDKYKCFSENKIHLNIYRKILADIITNPESINQTKNTKTFMSTNNVTNLNDELDMFKYVNPDDTKTQIKENKQKIENLMFIDEVSDNNDDNVDNVDDENEEDECSTGVTVTNTKITCIRIVESDKMDICLVTTKTRQSILSDFYKKHHKKMATIDVPYFSIKTNTDSTLPVNYGVTFEKKSASDYKIINNDITHICKSYSFNKSDLIKTSQKVYLSVLENLAKFKPSLDLIADFIGTIDVLYCKTYIATKYNYCKPIIENSQYESSYVSIKGLRHCLIEHIQQSELYISNDIELGCGTNGMLLYGTNAVGKTSLIRALGISVVMAQAGLFVPASTFKYYPYKYIFTRIIGNDNLFKGLSTFAVEMSELRTILRLTNKNSLVLGDELCSGTESISATSIFVAGILKLINSECSFVFATHLHEILSYDEIESLTATKQLIINHMSVIYDKERQCLVYNRKLQDGAGTNMYGLEVCKSLSLPTDFLELANEIRKKYNNVLGGVSTILGNESVSRYNSKKIKDICELCGKNEAIDVHHMIYQQSANDKGYIQTDNMTFHKNATANLACICEKCHEEIHKQNKVLKKTKTTKGYIFEVI